MMAAVLTIVLLAAPSEALSRAHFAKAQRAFAQHDWRRALDEFTGAVESAPAELPDLWFDIAQCHRNLGHGRQAAAAFSRYLALAPEAPDRDKVRALIVALGGKPPPEEPPPSAAPSPAPPLPAADPAPTAALAPSSAPSPAAAAAPVEGKPAVAAAAALPLVPAVDAPPPARAHRRWKVWTGVAVGVALVAVGVGLGVGLGTSSGGGGTTAPATPALGTAANFDTRSR